MEKERVANLSSVISTLKSKGVQTMKKWIHSTTTAITAAIASATTYIRPVLATIKDFLQKYFKLLYARFKDSSRESKICFIAALLVLALLLFGYMMHSSKRSIKETVSAQDYEKIRLEFENRTKEYNERNAMLLNSFMRDLQNAGGAEYKRAYDDIDTFVDKCSSCGFYKDMCIKLVSDRKNNTDTASEEMQNRLRETIMGHLLESDAAVVNAYENFILQLQESDNQYRAALAEMREIDSDLTKLNCFKELVKQNQDIVAQLKINSTDAFCTTAAAAIEALCIKSTVKLAIKICSKVAAGIAKKSAAAAIAPFVDGWLPFGDIFAVIMAAKCAHDVYDLAVTVPRELRGNLQRAVQGHRQQILAEVVGKAKIAVFECERQSREIQQQLFQE